MVYIPNSLTSNIILLLSLVHEDSRLCDGIGGVVWDGAIIASFVLEEIIPLLTSKTTLLGLGEGAGLTSISCSKSMKSTQDNITVIGTDRYIDLLDINIRNNNLQDKIKSKILNWDNPEQSILDLEDLEENMIIFGVEIACLVKQQHKLINTIKHICKSSSNSIILITFDDQPSNQSNYEKQFIQLMKNENYAHAVIFTGSVQWDLYQNNAFLYDYTNRYYNDLNHVAFPRIREQKEKEIVQPNNKDQNPPIPFKDNLTSTNTHHIIAFYKVAKVSTCKNCNKSFFPFLNDKCLHHQGYYVCRYHPSETKSNINGLGDFEGYYCGGKEGYEAKFWDCCGKIDKNAPGCNISYHEAYS